MKIIVGLGNPGKKYTHTRHNIGFLFVDFLARHFDTRFQLDKKFQAEVAEIHTAQEKILLVKPATFMNHSGVAVSALLQYYQLLPEHLIVAHDDVDIQAGTYKTTLSSRSAGNNGVQSIIETIGTQDFMRIRLGIGTAVDTLGICMPTHDYVLAPFKADERKDLEALFPELLSFLKL